MNILLISHRFFPDIGGIESVSEMLAHEFTRQKNEVILVTWSLTTIQDRFPFKVVRNPSIFTLFKLIKQADVILENNPCLRLSWVNIFLRKPMVVALHTWLKNSKGKIGLNEIIKWGWLRNANYVISCSNALSLKVFKKSIVIHNSYDNNLFRIITEIKKTKDFVFVGRLVSDKGIDLALKAFGLFIKEFPQSHFTIIGQGEEYGELNKLVEVLGIVDNVTFRGTLRGENLVETLNQHRYLLVPSVWEEPFGIVTLEGMACGCVPIVSDGGGLPEAVGDAGLLFKRGDINDLFKCMKLIKTSSQTEFELRDKSVNHLKMHCIEDVALNYLDVIKKALNE